MSKFTTTNQKLTRYAFLCGYFETAINSEHSNVLTLSLDCTWQVKTHGFDVRTWENFENYKDAWKFFMLKAKQLNLKRVKQHCYIGKVFQEKDSYLYVLSYDKNHWYNCYCFATGEHIRAECNYLESIKGKRLINGQNYIDEYNRLKGVKNV